MGKASKYFTKGTEWVDNNPLSTIGAGISLIASAAGLLAISTNSKRASIENKIKLLGHKIEEIRNNPKEFTKLEPIYKNDKEFVVMFIKEIPQIWHYIPEKLKNDKNFIKLLEREKITIPNSIEKEMKSDDE